MTADGWSRFLCTTAPLCLLLHAHSLPCHSGRECSPPSPHPEWLPQKQWPPARQRVSARLKVTRSSTEGQGEAGETFKSGSLSHAWQHSAGCNIALLGAHLESTQSIKLMHTIESFGVSSKGISLLVWPSAEKELRPEAEPSNA